MTRFLLIASVVMVPQLARAQAELPTVEQAVGWYEELSPQKKALALAVSQLGVNEASFDRPHDYALIWQVVEGRHSSTHKRMMWLRAHSSCVLGLSKPSERRLQAGNCVWTRNLTWSDRKPNGWDKKNRVPWRLFVRKWRLVRAFVTGLVSGNIQWRPCEVAPETWGGAMDEARAKANGLVPVSCDGTENTGYRHEQRKETLSRAVDGSVDPRDELYAREYPRGVRSGDGGSDIVFRSASARRFRFESRCADIFPRVVPESSGGLCYGAIGSTVRLAI